MIGGRRGGSAAGDGGARPLYVQRGGTPDGVGKMPAPAGGTPALPGNEASREAWIIIKIAMGSTNFTNDTNREAVVRRERSTRQVKEWIVTTS